MSLFSPFFEKTYLLQILKSFNHFPIAAFDSLFPTHPAIIDQKHFNKCPIQFVLFLALSGPNFHKKQTRVFNQVMSLLFGLDFE